MQSRIWGVGAIILAVAFLGMLAMPVVTQATIPNRQPWTHVAGTCDPALQGAVFGRPGDGCGGIGTTFDASNIEGPVILRDVASAAAPCPGIANGAPCYRMWYTGFDAGGVRRIGYAVSPDGTTWARVPGTAGGGAALGLGPGGSFDSNGVSFPYVLRNGNTFEMWYNGFNGSTFTFGYATSTDGLNWTRVTGPLLQGAVLRPTGAATFDQTIVAAPRVVRDQASAALPCENGRTSGTCYRMWYQGTDAANTFRIGYALSPDGVTWTRAAGGNAVLDLGATGAWDAASVGAPVVVKDGALFRMWYNNQSTGQSIGHVVSTDGIVWVRPNPNAAVYTGANDPGTLSPDTVWTPFVIKEGASYRLWYTMASRPGAVRIGQASVTPGTPLAGTAVTQNGNEYTLSFTTQAIAAGGSVLVTLPANIPFGEVSSGAPTGFPVDASYGADAAAVSDAAAQGTTRGALVVRLPSGAAAGAKTLSFTLVNTPVGSAPVTIQTYDTREVLEYATLALATAPEPTPVPTGEPTPIPSGVPTATPVTPSATPVTPSATPVTPTATPVTPTATNTPVTPSATPAPTADPSNRQPWLHLPGSCPAGAQGAVFTIAGQGCGGAGTSFDTSEIFPPMVLRDTASVALPCENGRTSGPCYRMWYVGVDATGVRRIGHARSADGITWTRFVGAGVGGSVFGPSAVAGNFDSAGVSTLSVVRDGATYRMWYSGFGDTGRIEGLGYATSPDGVTWTRVPGTAGTAAPNRNAVLVERGGNADFDQEYIVGPSVIIDEASVALPCENGRTTGRCFRMWYEGVNNVSAYTFAIGYALSPDGVTWTRVLGAGTGGAVLSSSSGFVAFDTNGNGVPAVMKDGALFRMWYEAKDYSVPDRFTVGYVVSTDGVNWVRPTPNEPVYDATDDPATFSPDGVWATRMLKDGATYRMYYTVSIRPNAQRFGLAEMTPGTALGAVGLSNANGLYALTFTTSRYIAAGGSVLITLPPEADFGQVTVGAISGFGAGATLEANPAAVTDAASGGTARGALLIRLPNGADAGPKTVTFSMATLPVETAAILIQTFDQREVLEYGSVFLNGIVPTATATNTPLPTATATNTPLPTATATNTPLPTEGPSPTATNIPTATNTPVVLPNSALRFDGVNDDARGPQIAGLTGAQTVEFWVRPAANGQNSVVVAHGDDNIGWSIELNNGRMTWWMLSTGGWRSAQNNTALAANTWYHVAAVYNGNSAQVYVNGVAGPTSTIGTVTTGPAFRIGGLAGYGFFSGDIDDVRVSNIARYTATFTPPTAAHAADANTRALYRFDEGSGQTVADASGNGYTLTLGTGAGADTADPLWVASTSPIAPPPAPTATPTATNTPLPTATATNTPTATNGPSPTPSNTPTATNTPLPTATATNTPVPPPNSALRFDGVNDDARGPQIAGLTGAQTIEFWVRPAVNGQDAVVVAQGDDNTGWSIELNNGRVTWWLSSTNGWRAAQNNTTLAANTWYHVAAVYNGNSAQVYVNGVAGPTSTIGTVTTGPAFRIGGLAGYGFFNGDLDVVRASNVARYTAAFTPPASTTLAADANTRALYFFNEGSGQTVADASGNGYTLTLGTGAGADTADPLWVASTAP